MFGFDSRLNDITTTFGGHNIPDFDMKGHGGKAENSNSQLMTTTVKFN